MNPPLESKAKASTAQQLGTRILRSRPLRWKEKEVLPATVTNENALPIGGT